MAKRTVFCVLGLLVLAAAGFLFAPLVCAPRVTPENYQRIREGMRLADVEGILGVPKNRQFRAAWHMDMRTVERLHPDFSPEKEVAEAMQWRDRGGVITVGFLSGGEVAFKRYDPFPEESFADKLHRWLLRV